MLKPWKIIIFFITVPLYAATGPTPRVEKQVGSIEVQFDLTRVIVPTPIQGTNHPPSWRAYLPVCPPGSRYVSGVNSNLLELDQAPNFAYCNCICKGICSGLSGITSPGGRNPIYTATVTCSTTVQGWYDSGIFSSGKNSVNLENLTKAPHQFYYCQAGNCSTHPLPANLAYSVPTGGYNNTIKIDFEACPLAIANSCNLAPDPRSPGKAAGTIPINQ